MAVNKITFAQSGTVDQTRGPSGRIWGDCPWNTIVDDPGKGIAFFDDFLDFPLPGTQTTQITLGRYKVYNTGAGVVQSDAMPHSSTASVVGGVISTLCDTSGDASALGTQASPFLLTTTQLGKVWFEARVAIDSILTATGTWFVGLAENLNLTYGAAIPLGTSDAVSNAGAFLGFTRLSNGLAVLNSSSADHATGFTHLQTSANTTLLAQTWIKLGMTIDFQDTTRCVRFFVDNVECTTAMTKAALLAMTFIDVSGLGPCWAFFAGASGTACYTYMDWWRAAQTFQ